MVNSKHELDSVDKEPPTLLEGGATVSARPQGKKPAKQDTEMMLSPFGGPSDDKGAHIAGRYRVLSLLGRGGAGDVYRVYDEKLDEIIALKTLRTLSADDSHHFERFKQEVKFSRRVSHPNVARVFDLGEEDGQFFLTMEYLDGISLSEYLNKRQTPSPEESLGIALELCEGLDAAHQAQVIHRDIKPANILLDGMGRVVLTDFGIAQLLAPRSGEMFLGSAQEDGALVGTPHYMAPEQLEGAPDIDHRADIYALGVVMYELFSGTRVWRGKDLTNLLYRRLHEVPPPLKQICPDLPAILSDIVERCMATSRDERYDRVSQISAMLRLLPIQPLAPMFAAPGSAEGKVALDAPSERSTLPRTSREHWTARREGIRQSTKIAVLPLLQKGDDVEWSWIEDFTEDFIDLLSMTETLQVCAYGLAQSMWNQYGDAFEVGKRLGLDIVLSGVVRKAEAGKVQLILRLHSVSDGFQVWAKRVNGEPNEFASALDSWVQEIAQALNLNHQENTYLTTTDPVAIDLYFQARQELRKRWHGDLTDALAIFHEALMRAPTDPILLSFAAVTHARRAFFLPTVDKDQTSIAWDFVERAMRIASHRGEPHFAHALLMFGQGRIGETLLSLQQTIHLAPVFAEAYELMGRILLECGPLEQSVAWLERAQAMEPSLIHVRWDRLRGYAFLGRWEEAHELAALEVESRGWLYREIQRMRLHMWNDSLPWLLEPVPENLDVSGFIEPYLMSVIPRLQEVVRTRHFPEETRAMIVTHMHNPKIHSMLAATNARFIAELDLFVGNLDGFFHWMEQAVKFGLKDLVWFEHCPLILPHRQDLRYSAVHQAIKQNIGPVPTVQLPVAEEFSPQGMRAYRGF